MLCDALRAHPRPPLLARIELDAVQALLLRLALLAFVVNDQKLAHCFARFASLAPALHVAH